MSTLDSCDLHEIPFRVLFRSSLLSVHDYVCRRHDPGLTEEIEAPFPAIVFPRRGVFLKKVEGEQVVADVNHAIFFNPHETYRLSHPCGCDDQVLELALAEPVFRELLADIDPARAESERRLFDFRSVAADSKCWMLSRMLRDCLSGKNTPDPLQVEEICLHLAARAIRQGCTQRDETQRPGRRRSTKRAHDDLVRQTQLLLADRYDEQWSIGGLAREVASSPFHLCRIFKMRTGLTVHTALNRLRLRAAQDRLANGATCLPQMALDLGYSSHSHFTNAFRREFGLTPSAILKPRSLNALRNATR